MRFQMTREQSTPKCLTASARAAKEARVTQAKKSRRKQFAATASEHIQPIETEQNGPASTNIEVIDAEQDISLEDTSDCEELTKPFHGGPTDVSVLKSFPTHIAASVWKNKSRDPMRCMCKTTTLRDWKWQERKDNNNFKGYIKASSLYPLVHGSYPNADKIVVYAFVERWHPATNSFHLPIGEMTITLDDVSNILGIPIVGNVVSARAQNNMGVVDLLVKYLGIGVDKASMECSRFSGYTFFIDKTRARVHVMYLNLLRDLDTVGSYAWGSGTLYRQLGQASRAGVKQIAGYLTLLEAWIYEHLYIVVRCDYQLNYSDEILRVQRWIPHNHGKAMAADLQKLRIRLNGLTHDQVIWDPYTSCRAEQPLNEISFYQGMLKCFEIVEPYYPERVLRLFGLLQMIPPVPHAPLRSKRGLGANYYKIVYDYLEGMWESWMNHKLSTDKRSVRDRDAHILNITRPIISMGQAEVLRRIPNQVYKALKSMQHILEGTYLTDTLTYRHRHGRGRNDENLDS